MGCWIKQQRSCRLRRANHLAKFYGRNTTYSCRSGQRLPLGPTTAWCQAARVRPFAATVSNRPQVDSRLSSNTALLGRDTFNESARIDLWSRDNGRRADAGRRPLIGLRQSAAASAH
jgi:hypothetical protein